MDGEKVTEIITIQYQLESLSVTDAEAHVVPEFSEELHMLDGVLPDAVIQPGTELIEGLDAIPDKMAFKIGEAAEMVGVKQYVLRYWESEFEMLRPRKSKNNQRVYSRRDVETAMMIKKLLYDDRFSIEGARAALRQLKTQVKEDRGIKRMVETHESALSSALSQMHGLVDDIRRARSLFAI
jgi:DNA-binding transcriptional MerR regulator